MKLIVNNGGYFDWKYNGVNLEIKVNIFGCIDFGLIVDETIMIFQKDSSQRVQLIDDKDNECLFEPKFQSDINRLKVGGHRVQL